MKTWTVEQIQELLKQVIDPELGINIVDLGLLYGIEVNETDINVTMTLTTPGCPLHDTISGGVEQLLKLQEGIQSVQVEVVWRPAWTPERMTPAAKKRLQW
ncbi:metal-sulfur cluster assembly factor [Paenibacillus turpanensis]|uniref:metal-sulfur cluster assembly factor n=1 Tax=Paenibacillus turpanensis TaxID=2689078 RepID=UPI00140B46F7|nr:metal-sulfur cluster assembly factor [Paenibacillus turpanensis]